MPVPESITTNDETDSTASAEFSAEKLEEVIMAADDLEEKFLLIHRLCGALQAVTNKNMNAVSAVLQAVINKNMHAVTDEYGCLLTRELFSTVGRTVTSVLTIVLMFSTFV